MPLRPNLKPNKKAPFGAFLIQNPNHNLLHSVVVFAKNLAEERFFVPGWACWGVGDFSADGVVDVGEQGAVVVADGSKVFGEAGDVISWFVVVLGEEFAPHVTAFLFRVA